VSVTVLDRVPAGGDSGLVADVVGPGPDPEVPETVYAITSLTATQTNPTELADVIRGHWTIEDRLH
jgi:hypothetical protein